MLQDIACGLILLEFSALRLTHWLFLQYWGSLGASDTVVQGFSELSLRVRLIQQLNSTVLLSDPLVSVCHAN